MDGQPVEPRESVGTIVASVGFPRSARLLDGKSYAPVFRKNRRLADCYWTVLVHDSVDGEARLGLAIAKKRAKRAVDRNRLKRIARESFRQHRQALGSRRFVVMNRDAATSAAATDLRRALDLLFVKAMKSESALRRSAA